ncbi:surface-adhesin E family protein [Alysiella crassa]|uniref:Surface-adhesin protein E-like domain-containing protein n=2 Tax=Alysiella crassa TaxID=153491 RepID=A0A376BKR9_9NEIS|nr:surface-adhesin E family protein [Alysiella crassa]SSY70352.1 Uncharacterised protein [Alysiella crassa]
MKFTKYSMICMVTVLLAACGGGGGAPNMKNVPSIAGSWKNLGSTSNGNLVASYDSGSIRRNGDLAYLRDRKIVVNPDQERYSGTPRYKVAVSDWEFHCRNRSFRLTAVQFFDEKGKILSQERYTTNPIPPMPIARGTIAEKQLGIACK